MLYDPTRHEALRPVPWNEDRAREVIERIVSDTERHFSPDRYWPIHPRDIESDEDKTQRKRDFHGEENVCDTGLRARFQL